ncbi:aldo/keto reductase [Streptomyces sp. WSLK1-5]|uniref:aldo/keto reductase n=1 Tax=unclassified Streptomyces TaxID=2593676 RepID=UPI003796B8FD
MTDSTIPTARLGDTGPAVGVQGLGCMGMSFAYGPTDAKESRATLERALELGITLYDTADAYGNGENETFLSPFFKAHRDEVVIATKFALSIPADDPTRRIIRNDPPYIRKAVEASLKRLDVDAIDLYYMHRRDVDVPIPGTRKPARVAENAAATRIELTKEQLELLEPIAGQVAGDRYADMRFSSAGRE